MGEEIMKVSDPFLPLATETAHFSALSAQPVEYSVPSRQPAPADNYASVSSADDVHASNSTTLPHPDDPTTLILARLLSSSTVLALSLISTTASSKLPSNLPPVHLRLPAAAVPSIGLFHDAEAEALHIILLTADGSLFRLAFALPALCWGATLPDGWASEFILRSVETEGRTPGTVEVVDLGTVLVGMTDGTLVKLEQLRGMREMKGGGLFSFYHDQWSEATLRQSSILSSVRSLLPSLGSSRTLSLAAHLSPTQALSIAGLTTASAAYAFTLSRDRKLRIWSLVHQACVRTILLSSASEDASPLAGDPRTLLRVVSDPAQAEGAAYVVVCLPEYVAPIFLVYSVETDESGVLGEIALVAERYAEPAADLRDIRVSPPSALNPYPTLWALYERGGAPYLQYTALPEITPAVPSGPFQPSWQTVTPRALPPLDPAAFADHLQSAEPGTSLPDVFMSVLFASNAFSPHTHARALEEYTRLVLNELPPHERPHNLLDPPLYDTLADHATDVVARHVRMEVDPASGAQKKDEYEKRVKTEWLRFASLIGELNARAQYPLHLALTDRDALVVQAEAISAPVAEDPTQLLHRLASADPATRDAFLDAAPVAVEPYAPALAPQDRRAAVVNVLGLAQALVGALPLDRLRALEDAVQAVARGEMTGAKEDVLRQVWNEKGAPVVPPAVREQVAGALANAQDLEPSVEAALEVLASSSVLPGAGGGGADSAPSDLGNTLIASHLASAFHDRYALARNVLFLVCFAHTLDRLAAPARTLNTALAVAHTASLLRWLAQRGAADEPVEDEDQTEDENDGLADRLGSLRVSGGGGDSAARLPTTSLLHALLRTHQFGVSLPAQAPSPLALAQAASAFLGATGALEQPTLAARPVDTRLAFALYRFRWGTLASELCRAFWKGGVGVAYVRGRAGVDAGRWDEAREELEKAAVGVVSNDPSLREILPADVDSLSAYYAHVAAVFDHAGVDAHVAHFAQLAIDEKPRGEEAGDDARELWFKVFRAQAARGKYEDAYAALMGMPFEDLKRESLRHLISVMCESGDVARLTQFSFVGLQPEVERTLAFKARNSDPLARPNYYEVLHAYHVFRGDFRSAGAIMYQQGRRLAEVQCRPGEFGDIATLQAQSYLAAINALALVEKQHAWVALPVAPEAALRTRKRRKLTVHLPESEFAPETKDLEVVKLDDMRREYTLVLARLQLSQHFPELASSNLSLAAEDVVALFVQRGLFGLAISSARTLDVDMTGLFASLTMRCVQLSKLGDFAEESELGLWILLDDQASCWEGSLADRAWRYLQLALERHDTPEAEHRYRSVVLEQILELDRRFGIPAWLLRMFEYDPAHLIRAFARYELYEDALQTAIAMVRKTTSSLQQKPTRHAAGTWLPYALIDQLVASARGVEDPRVRELVRELEGEIRRRVGAVERVWGS